MSRKGVRRKWINPTFTGNGPAFEEDTVVYKLVGPVLVEQETDEAKANVKKRIDYLNTELWVSRKKDEKDKHHTHFFLCCFMFDWKRVEETLCLYSTPKKTKTKRVVCQKIQKQSLSDQNTVILSNIRTNTVQSLLQVIELQQMLQQAPKKGVSK